MPGALAQGLIWAIMAIGVYLTFRILDVADLTVDGTLGLGGAVCIMCMISGMNVWLSLLLAFGAGLLAGLVTGLFHNVYGHSGHPCRYLDPVVPIFGQPENHGKSQSGYQCGQI